jgi:acetyl-CoA carboxylase biotin carboxyl carrier protein
MWKVCAANMATGRKGSKPATTTRSSSSANAEAVTGSVKSRGNGSNSTQNGATTDIVETVRGLAQVVADHTLSELIVDLPEATITLRRGGAAPAALHMPAMQMPLQMPMQMPMPTAAHGLAPAPVAAAPAPAAAPAVEDKSHVVTSPFVGTFYRRPNPDANNYVEVGQKVEKGAVLCIIEAMKLMNEIEADVAGVVVGVMADDATAVEYGQPLFKIAPA